MADGSDKLVIVVSARSAAGKYFESVIVPAAQIGAFSPPENKLHGYADYSTLTVVEQSSDVRVAVAQTFNRDLSKASEWFDLCDKIECE